MRAICISSKHESSVNVAIMSGASVCEEQAKIKKSRVFLHTQTQTLRSMKAGRDMLKLKSCNTQTYEMVSRGCQSAHERSTQIESSVITESPRISINGQGGEEKILTPQKYISSDQLLGLKRQKAILLQKNWRGYSARKRKKYMKVNSTSTTNCKITSQSPAPTETKQPNSIQVKTSIPRRLRRLIEPTKWTLSNEEVVQVQSPSNVRAEKCVSLYKDVSRFDDVNVNERLGILLRAKQLVNASNEGTSTREITDLIDREADLLHRGRGAASLQGLRKRLCNLILCFIEENSKCK
mmetsp:Transcript_9142/g.13657  ORF Transcript_9142/g.13657 Transcript_9142/m.13657 type:complete len:295 (-) Transcript_9142:3005-3889(-)